MSGPESPPPTAGVTLDVRLEKRRFARLGVALGVVVDLALLPFVQETFQGELLRRCKVVLFRKDDQVVIAEYRFIARSEAAALMATLRERLKTQTLPELYGDLGLDGEK